MEIIQTLFAVILLIGGFIEWNNRNRRVQLENERLKREIKKLSIKDGEELKNRFDKGEHFSQAVKDFSKNKNYKKFTLTNAMGHIVLKSFESVANNNQDYNNHLRKLLNRNKVEENIKISPIKFLDELENTEDIFFLSLSYQLLSTLQDFNSIPYPVPRFMIMLTEQFLYGLCIGDENNQVSNRADKNKEIFIKHTGKKYFSKWIRDTYSNVIPLKEILAIKEISNENGFHYFIGLEDQSFYYLSCLDSNKLILFKDFFDKLINVCACQGIFLLLSSEGTWQRAEYKI